MDNKKLCVLEKALKTLEEQKRITKKFAQTIINILDVLYEITEEDEFWVGEILLTPDGYYLDGNEWYEDENGKHRTEVKIVTNTYWIRNGGYMHGEYDFHSNYYEWWVKTVNRHDLLYIAKNLKKWIIEYIEKEEKFNEKLQEGLNNLKKDFEDLNKFLENK